MYEVVLLKDAGETHRYKITKKQYEHLIFLHEV